MTSQNRSYRKFRKELPIKGLRSKPQFDYRNRVSSSYNIGHKKSNYILCEITKNVNFMVSMQSDMQGFFKNLFFSCRKFFISSLFQINQKSFFFSNR